jgi:hypothetical protein
LKITDACVEISILLFEKLCSAAVEQRTAYKTTAAKPGHCGQAGWQQFQRKYKTDNSINSLKTASRPLFPLFLAIFL